MLKTTELDQGLPTGLVETIKASSSPLRWEKLALAYQLTGNVEGERQALNHAAAERQASGAALDRLAWLNGVEYRRLAPRKSVQFDKDPKWTPEKDSMDALCFVTIGGGDRVFTDMLDSLESLRRTPSYGSHPIYVVDTGLSDEQKQILVEKFSVSGIYNPAERFKKLGPRHQSWVSIAYFPEFFPGHRYYFHLECDTWIQDERSIDKFLTLCERQGWALDGWNIGIYCIDSLSDLGPAWREKIKSNPLIAEKGGNEVYRGRKLHFLKNLDHSNCPGFMYQYTKPAAPIGLTNNNMVWHTGIPLVDDQGVLLDPIHLRPVGILHIHKPCEYIRDGGYKVTTRSTPHGLDEIEWKRHLDISRQQLVGGGEASDNSTGQYDRPISIRYRTAAEESPQVLWKRLIGLNELEQT